MNKKILVFGVFDNFHEGHKHFLNQAKKRGDLIVVIARDNAVKEIKGREPKWHELKRMEIVKQFVPEATVVLGDEMRGNYTVVKNLRPDMICLGYDQTALGEDLRAKIAAGELPPIELVELKPHEPEKYKSSKIV